MTNLYIPPKNLAVYAWCINDKLPNFQVDEWIQHDRVYRVKHMADPLNSTEGTALTITDQTGEEIHPSDSHWSFNSNRFQLFSMILN